ncbi:MAG TPA: anti-sigma factor domain-containing protein [Mobilitalea sp.]|nr:anti-sigma factor domain-containing protein [Mobilitalea sp.]
MKAVIVDISNGFASVLTDDGDFKAIVNSNYEIGQIIQMSKSKVSITKRFTMLAASVAAVIIISVGTWAYASPYSYVSVDVNPSIEFTVNMFDRVLRVNAVNDDGKAILDVIKSGKLKNKSIQSALSTTVEHISEAGYFDGPDEGGIIITTSAKNPDKAEDLADELRVTVEEEMIQSGETVEFEVLSVGQDRVEEAHELGVTPGKLNLVEKLRDSSSDPASVNLEDWLDKPVKDIMKATKDNIDISKNSNKSPESNDSKEITNQAQDKADDKNSKKQDKADDKASKAQDKIDKIENKNSKTQDKAGKAENKTSKTQNKADDKASKSQDKADDKVSKSQNKADSKTSKVHNKADDKVTTTQDKADDKASKSQDKADDKVSKTQDKADDNISETQDKTNDWTSESRDKVDDILEVKENQESKAVEVDAGEASDELNDRAAVEAASTAYKINDETAKEDMKADKNSDKSDKDIEKKADEASKENIKADKNLDKSDKDNENKADEASKEDMKADKNSDKVNKGIDKN